MILGQNHVGSVIKQAPLDEEEEDEEEDEMETDADEVNPTTLGVILYIISAMGDVLFLYGYFTSPCFLYFDIIFKGPCSVF